MRKFKCALLVTAILATANIAVAKPEIRAFHNQKRCAALLKSDQKGVELLVGKQVGQAEQLFLFSNSFDKHKGEMVRSTIAWKDKPAVTGTFRITGPAISLPIAGEFASEAAKGGTLTVHLDNPVNIKAEFDLSDASTLYAEIDACLTQFKAQ